MTIGDVNSSDYGSGMMHLVRETVGNSVDEFLADHATSIHIQLDTQQNSIVVVDDGRGIPLTPHKTEKGLTNFEVAISHINTGAKYDKGDGKAFHFALGAHGHGAKAVCFLARDYKAATWRDGRYGEIAFAEGLKAHNLRAQPLGDAETTPSGTRIAFVPDPAIFGELRYNPKHLQRYCAETAQLNAGLKVHLTVKTSGNDEPEQTTFLSPRGIEELLDNTTRDRPLLCRFPLIAGETPEGNRYEVALALLDDQGEVAKAFVNGGAIETSSAPVVATRQALAKSLKKYIDDHAKLPARYKNTPIRPEDARAGSSIVVKILHKNPQFDSQTKTKMVNPDMGSHMGDALAAAIYRTLLAEPATADAAVKKILHAVDLRVAAERARKQVAAKRKGGSGRDVPSVSLDIYTPPLVDDPETNRLYLTEGQSAAGSLIRAAKNKNPRTGFLYKRHLGILTLKGIPLNALEVTMARVMQNTELATLIEVAGLNPKEPDDLSGLRFKDFVIASDADPAGAHIQVLLTNFFAAHFPQVLRENRLHRVLTPFFEVKVKKPPATHFIYENEKKQDGLVRIGLGDAQQGKDYTIKRVKGLAELSEKAGMTLIEPPLLSSICPKPSLVPVLLEALNVYSGRAKVKERRGLIFSQGLTI